MILDTNALYNQTAAFTNSTIQQLASLSSRHSIRLIIPEVVLHELSRQWARNVRLANEKLVGALDSYNAWTAKAGVSAVNLKTPDHERGTFFDEASLYLESVRVELPAFPSTLSLDDVLTRDLDQRKPFDEKGKGFRDALIWETVREIVADLDADVTVIFVTDNWSDFQVEAGGAIHPDLQIDLTVGRTIDVVANPTKAVEHPEIKPLLEAIHAAEVALTPAQVFGLAEAAMDDLANVSLRDALGEYDGDGMTHLPIETPLQEPELSGYDVDFDSLDFSFFHTAGPTEMGLRVTVTVDCELDGYLDRSDATLYYDDHSTVHVHGEWNRWTVTATETRTLRIQFGASFSPDDIDVLQLQVEHIDDVTDNVRLSD